MTISHGTFPLPRVYLLYMYSNTTVTSVSSYLVILIPSDFKVRLLSQDTTTTCSPLTMFFLQPLVDLLYSVFPFTKGQEDAWEIQARTQETLVNELIASEKQYHDIAQVSAITAYIVTSKQNMAGF
jgi:hypothetical protein